MAATLSDFRQALLAPDLHFATLAAVEPVKDAAGIPMLHRTTRFAEAQILRQGGRWLLFMPLSASAMLDVERTAVRLKRMRTDLLTEYRLLPGEMAYADATGATRRTDLILQRLPEGMIAFEEALASYPRRMLLQALDTLQQGLRELHFTHRNLKDENLVWSRGRFVPLRYHYARFGSGDGDAEAFETLRRRIGNLPDAPVLSDVAAPYEPSRRPAGHRWASHLFEGLICVEDDTGFGFVDAENRPVIASQFRWAGDFREGRAEVETPTGMGLIDKQGGYVIPPEYEIVAYDAEKSVVRVRRDGQWALFDYLGRRLTEFGTINETEESGCECN